MHPILFRIGDFPVGTYAVFALLGLAALVLVFSWLGSREGHDRWTLAETALWTFIVAIAASKVFGAVLGFDPADPMEAVRKLVRFGGHYWVGFLAGFTFLVVALRRRGVPLAQGLDALAPGLALGHAIGRIGCFLAGCCWGLPCDAAWAVTFTSENAHAITGVPLGVALHPTQLYEVAAELLIFALLLAVHLRARRFTGQTFLHYVLLYGVARFGLEFLRDDNRGQAFATFSTTQVLLVPTLVVAAALYALRWRDPRAALPFRRAAPTPSAPNAAGALAAAGAAGSAGGGGRRRKRRKAGKRR
jgi:phosphatidylglycerol:prolipoprotein diacylglycerol transferase